MNTEQLINAVRNATGGTFLPEFGTTTLLGWMQEYDELGRPLFADPNTTTGDIRIAGKTYILSKSGWWAHIKDPETNTTIDVDLRPDYIKELDEKRYADE
jgi:hypothetical protein